jgi:hypothetical protein
MSHNPNTVGRVRGGVMNEAGDPRSVIGERVGFRPVPLSGNDEAAGAAPVRKDSKPSGDSGSAKRPVMEETAR